MLLHRRRSPRLVIAGALAMTWACQDNRVPTAPPTSANAAITAAAAANGKVRVKQLQLSSNTLRINGPGATASVSIGNSGPAIQLGMSIRAVIVQGAVTREVANLSTKCLPGDAAGFLPNGNCTMDVAFIVANADGQTPLAPGAAEFVLSVVETVGAVATEVASKTIAVNLVGTPAITSVALTSLTLAIDGPSAGYSAVLQNPANALQGVVLQGTIVQGVARRAAGGLSVSCGGAPGVFPTGPCTINFSASASNTAGGTGTLAPGAAVFELKLFATSGGTTTTYDTKTVGITLVSSTPKITSLVMSSTSLVIGGASVDYTVQVQNPGFPASIVVLQGEMVQETAAGTAIRGAGGFSVTCGAAVGTLPTTGLGTCTMNLTTLASNTVGGGGTLVPGLARFVLHLYQTTGENTVELDTKTVEVTLVSPIPTITAINPASTYIVLGASFTSHTTTINNPGPSRTGITIQGWISQPGARRAAGGIVVQCTGSAAGTLPSGSCTTPGDIVAANGSASGTGTLVTGPATFEMQLREFDGTNQIILDTKTIPITLVASTPSIVSVALVSTTIPIGGEAAYTATLYNPTGATLTGVSVQGWMDQAPSTVRGAGGVSPSCGAGTGTVPPGVCLVSFRAVALNSGAGVGLLVPGAATFRLEMNQGGSLLDTKSTAVTLTSP